MEPDVIYRGGPREGQEEWIGDEAPVVIGDGSEGGVYQRTDAMDGGRRVYVWQELTDAQANALLRRDLRANQR